jgi:hypothetical protein
VTDIKCARVGERRLCGTLTSAELSRQVWETRPESKVASRRRQGDEAGSCGYI